MKDLFFEVLPNDHVYKKQNNVLFLFISLLFGIPIVTSFYYLYIFLWLDYRTPIYSLDKEIQKNINYEKFDKSPENIKRVLDIVKYLNDNDYIDMLSVKDSYLKKSIDMLTIKRFIIRYREKKQSHIKENFIKYFMAFLNDYYQIVKKQYCNDTSKEYDIFILERINTINSIKERKYKNINKIDWLMINNDYSDMLTDIYCFFLRFCLNDKGSFDYLNKELLYLCKESKNSMIEIDYDSFIQSPQKILKIIQAIKKSKDEYVEMKVDNLNKCKCLYLKKDKEHEVLSAFKNNFLERYNDKITKKYERELQCRFEEYRPICSDYFKMISDRIKLIKSFLLTKNEIRDNTINWLHLNKNYHQVLTTIYLNYIDLCYTRNQKNHIMDEINFLCQGKPFNCSDLNNFEVRKK